MPIERFKKNNTATEKTVQVIQVIKGDKGDTGPTPTDAKIISLIKPLLPTDEKLTSLIEPLIPEPKKGDKGDTYKLTAIDKKEIAQSVKVPIVEKVIEKSIVNNIENKDTPEEVRDKLESLVKGEKLSIEAIEDLAKILEDLSKEVKKGALGLLKGSIHGRGASSSVRFIDDETPSGTINGVNTDFTISKNPIDGSVKVYRNGSRMRVTEDYTLLGKVITFIVPPQVGEIILVDFRY